MWTSLCRTIKNSLGRYLAIVGIIALGSAMFVGLKATKTDMVATGQIFMDSQNMFDLQLFSSVGWDLSDVEKIASLDGVEAAEGVVSMDALVRINDSTEESVYKLYSIPEQINQVYLLGGRMPQAPNECLADGFHASDSILGRKITVSDNNTDDVTDSLTQKTFTVVGYVSTPLYMDMNRGTTTLGNGTVATYLYLPKGAFDVDYYTQIDITIPGDYAIYTQVYDAALEKAGDEMELLLQPIVQDRADRLYIEAENAYQDGLKEYNEGLSEYEKGKAEVTQELADAKKKLEDGQKELEDGKKLLEDSLKQIEDGQTALDENRRLFLKTKAETYQQLAQASSELTENRSTVLAALSQVTDGIDQIDSGMLQIDSGISQLESGLEQLDTLLSVLDAVMPAVSDSIERAEAALSAAEQAGLGSNVLEQLQKELANLHSRYEEYEAQRQQLHADQQQYTQQLEDLRKQKQELEQQRAELVTTKATLDASLTQINDGYLELQNAQLQADNELAAAEAQLEAAQLELDMGRAQAEQGQKDLDAAQKELAQGWEDYNEGYETAMAELADAQKELDEGKLELDNALTKIENLKDSQLYILDRNSNIGYVSLDSNSDIVEGVAAVFPVFFLLIAALVCITTMTRMIEEERTQIGTMKALGYGSNAIVSKYLLYAGSAAVIGCGLGVIAGSIVFPLILWQAYSIMMLLLPNLVLKFNWQLCIAVVSVYTVVTLAVTWYTCRHTMRDVPAELIRPKPPTSGKKIFLERIPFWNRIGFLNKVMLRNVFRYRQRFLMMLVGIGGCTALLLTGFGFRDSIMPIVDYQFSEITLYDIEVRFAEGLSEQAQEQFRTESQQHSKDLMFYHQSSMDLEWNHSVSKVSMIVSESNIDTFIDLHNGDNKLAFPKSGEAIISVGVSEKMGIGLNDEITLRGSDMQPLTVTVCGIYDNYIQNFVFVAPDTVTAQWGFAPEKQMACIVLRDGVDAHEAAAHLANQNHVLNVSVNQELAEQVGKMLEALNLVVITIVICAGLLAVIVLYNLTNINITERIREIATIKVLGFRSSESAAYVFKENLLLTVLGALIGLPAGILLLDFVMSQIRIDMIWMPPRLSTPSILLAVALTMLSACFVDFVLYFKLEKINMAEALKSVE